jgi:RTX calcium-binding nonapeptide repeat (4 copies)/WD40-like Beta Propeller Repeat
MRRFVTLVAIGLAAASIPAKAESQWAPEQRTLDAESSRAWSPSGRWLAIRDGVGLVGLAADGSGREAFRVNAAYLAWSPTRDRLVWTPWSLWGRPLVWTPASVGPDVFLLDLADGSERRLGIVGNPLWSPDGTTVVGVRQHFESADIVVLGVDGGEQVLARGPVDRPSWSPSGAEVGYTRYHTRCHTTIESVRADGTGGRVISESPEDGFIGPWWSPQGDRLLVVGRCTRKVVVFDRDGSNAHALPGVIPSLYDWRRHVEWSPDGRWIAVRGDDGRITLAEVDGGRRIEVAGWGAGWAAQGGAYAYWGYDGIGIVRLDGTRRGFGSGGQPVWSPDGRELAYERDAYPPGVPLQFLGCRSHLVALDVTSGRWRGLSRCRIDGGVYADVIHGTDGPDDIYALPGHDHVEAGAGKDNVWAGPGRDIVIGGAGPDRLLGGIGRDRLDARDGEVDSVSCGPGRDIALADVGDVVARNCELVRRS